MGMLYGRHDHIVVSRPRHAFVLYFTRTLAILDTSTLPHRSFLISLYTHISSILEMQRSDSFLHLLFFSAVDGNKLYRRVGTNGIEGSYLSNASRTLRLS